MYGALIAAPQMAKTSQSSAVDWLLDDGVGAKTRAGPEVNAHNSLTLPAVFRAVDTLASHWAMLPCRVLRRTGPDSVEPDRDHPVWSLLNKRANPEMTAMNYRRATFLHTMLWGNGRSEIERRMDGRPKWLWPLLPHMTTTRRDPESKRLYHEVLIDGRRERIDADDAIHTTGLGYDGIMGYGLIDMLARQNIGLHLAMTEYAQAFFGNNAMLGVIVSTPAKMDKESKKETLDALTSGRVGSRNAFKAMIFSGGEARVDHAGQTGKDSQIIEQMTFAVQDVSRWTNIPPPLLMDLSRATFANIEELGMWYVKFTHTPWYTVFEQEWEWKLFREDERAVYRLRFVPEQLLRGDLAKRMDGYTRGLGSGVYNIDEVRAWENLNPLPNGEGQKYRVPLNMTTTDAEPEQPDDNRDDGFANANRRNESSQSPPSADAVTQSFRMIFTETAERVMRRGHKAEEAAQKRCDGKPGDYEAWREKFREGHEKYMFDAFWPSWQAMGNLLVNGKAESVDDDLDRALRFVCDSQAHGEPDRVAEACIRAVLSVVHAAETCNAGTH